MSFFPTGPLTIASAAMIWSLSLLFLCRGTSAQKHIAAAFICSWIAARLATVTEMQVIGAVGWTVAAVVCFRGQSMFAKAIAALYTVRLALLSIVDVPLSWDDRWQFELSWFTFWELNRVFLWLQIALAIGTLLHGSLVATGRPFNSHRRGGAGVDLLARRGYVRRS